MASETASIEQSTGEWIMPAVSYVEPMRIFCALCGRPIARRHWRAAPDGKSLPFCDPAHEELYRTYWLPTHGGKNNAVKE